MPKVGGKKYAYTKKGKAAAKKARQKAKPMPDKPNPEFAKELKEGNEPKQLKSKGLSKGALEYQRRQEELERTELAEERQRGHEEYAAQLREWGVTTEDWDWALRLMQGVNKDRRLVAARIKARQDRKARQGTIGAAPKKKKKGERSVDVQAGQEATRSKVRKTKAPQRRGRKMVTKKSMRPGRFFRGRG